LSLVCLHGTDEGLLILTKQRFVEALRAQEARLAYLTEQEFLEDPHQFTAPTLWDEPGALTAVILSHVTPSHLEKILKALPDPLPKGVIYFLVGSKFKATTPGLKTIQNHAEMLVAAAYSLEPSEKKRLVGMMARAYNLRLSSEILDLITYGVPYTGFFSLFQKLALYDPSSPPSVEEVAALIHPEAPYARQLRDALALRQVPALKQWAQTTPQDTSTLLGAVRQTITYFLNLLDVVRLLQQNHSVDEAIKSLKPPLFFKDIPGFRQALRLWDADSVCYLLRVLAQAELMVKQQTTVETLVLSFLNDAKVWRAS